MALDSRGVHCCRSSAEPSAHSPPRLRHLRPRRRRPRNESTAQRSFNWFQTNGRKHMNDNRRQILEMLAAGKITADEAERLLAALNPIPTPVMPEFTGTTANGATVKTRAKY